MDSTQEENYDYDHEENKENQINKAKPVSLFDALSVRINNVS